MDAQYYPSRGAEVDELAGKFEAPEHQAEYRGMAESWRRLPTELIAADAGERRRDDQQSKTRKSRPALAGRGFELAWRTAFFRLGRA